MSNMGKVTEWSSHRQFGNSAMEVARCVTLGLARGQQTARAVQAQARAYGATDNHAYGSQWRTRQALFVEEFVTARVPGLEEVFTPDGASYQVVAVDGCVLIPFRHATSMSKSIGQAKLESLTPRRIARENGVAQPEGLFELPVMEPDDGDSTPDLADIIAEAKARKMTVVFIGYVANADSDEIQAAWWGVADTLDETGNMAWNPERLDLTVAKEIAPSVDLRLVGTDTSAPAFAQGDEPGLDVSAKRTVDDLPMSESEPLASDAVAEDDE